MEWFTYWRKSWQDGTLAAKEDEYPFDTHHSIASKDDQGDMDTIGRAGSVQCFSIPFDDPGI